MSPTWHIPCVFGLCHHNSGWRLKLRSMHQLADVLLGGRSCGDVLALGGLSRKHAVWWCYFVLLFLEYGSGSFGTLRTMLCSCRSCFVHPPQETAIFWGAAVVGDSFAVKKKMAGRLPPYTPTLQITDVADPRRNLATRATRGRLALNGDNV